MSFSSSPNQMDFTTFLVSVVGIDPLYLPANSPNIGWAFETALSIADVNLGNMGGNLYALAVYNLGADYIINFTPDQVVGTTQRTYFQDLRKSFGINSFVPGVIASSSNVGTSQSTLNPEFMKTLTLMDLQNMKTPYGRQYLAFAQMTGTIWGVS
jgi:hypothetical protein